MRDEMLRMGRGIAVILLVVYIGARVFLYKPTPKSFVQRRENFDKVKMSSWSCIVMLVATVAIMAVTVAFVSAVTRVYEMQYANWFQLVESVEDIRTSSGIRERSVIFPSF